MGQTTQKDIDRQKAIFRSRLVRNMDDTIGLESIRTQCILSHRRLIQYIEMGNYKKTLRKLTHLETLDKLLLWKIRQVELAMGLMEV